MNMPWALRNNKITPEYIAGFVQSDGSFATTLRTTLKTSKRTGKEVRNFNLVLRFTLTQKQRYLDLILEIQKYFGGIGTWRLDKADGVIRYEVNKQEDIFNVIIPFFMKHHVRSSKLSSFLSFKYIADVMSTGAHRGNRKVLLGLIVIASHMNPLGDIAKNVRYLNLKEQAHVLENRQPEGIDASKLTESIENFKLNELTLDFIHGLFDGDGSMTIYFVKSSEANRLLDSKESNKESLQEIVVQGKEDGTRFYVRYGFSFVQDTANESLLHEIQSFFNNEGSITDQGTYSLYRVSDRPALTSVVLPKMVDRKSLDWVDFPTDVTPIDPEIKLPQIKYDKIYYSCIILKFLSDGSMANTKENIDKFILWSYFVSEQSEQITLKEYSQNMKQKWLQGWES